MCLPFLLPLSLSISRGRKCKPIFVQIARQVVKLNASDLRLPSRAWKVKLVGEGADDAGGVFDDTITEMCQVTLTDRTHPTALSPASGGSEKKNGRSTSLISNGIDSLSHFFLGGAVILKPVFDTFVNIIQLCIGYPVS